MAVLCPPKTSAIAAITVQGDEAGAKGEDGGIGLSPPRILRATSYLGGEVMEVADLGLELDHLVRYCRSAMISWVGLCFPFCSYDELLLFSLYIPYIICNQRINR